MLNKDTLQKQLSDQNFISVNGRIMRILNLVFNERVTVNNLFPLIPEATQEDVIKSVYYLQEEEYVRLINPKTGEKVDISHVDPTITQIKLTGRGMRLLSGKKVDPAVEI